MDEFKKQHAHGNEEKPRQYMQHSDRPLQSGQGIQAAGCVCLEGEQIQITHNTSLLCDINI